MTVFWSSDTETLRHIKVDQALQLKLQLRLETLFAGKICQLKHEAGMGLQQASQHWHREILQENCLA